MDTQMVARRVGCVDLLSTVGSCCTNTLLVCLPRLQHVQTVFRDRVDTFSHLPI